VLAHFITPEGGNPLDSRNGRKVSSPSFPFLCLTVSGGHTQILVVESPSVMKVIGETKDDAVGEAFDKAAKILGLPYPGGPLIDKYSTLGNPKKYSFPDSVMPGLDFSFSGIKTSFLYFIRDSKAADPDFIEKNLNDICASLQFSLVKMLMSRVIGAVEQTGIRQVAIAGGVSANSGLRQSLAKIASERNWDVFVLPMEYCTDNAAMIAMAAHYKFLRSDFASLDIAPVPNLAV